MTQVSHTPLPKQSRLWGKVSTGDFIDGYAVKSPLSPHEAADLGFTMPGWVDALMRLRNAIVRPLGLKADTADTGDGAIFPVEYEGADEIILGTDDTHLNFRICIRQEAGQVHMATWVHRNNALGRAYLMLVMPFHRLIVRDTMRRIARGCPRFTPDSTLGSILGLRRAQHCSPRFCERSALLENQPEQHDPGESPQDGGRNQPP